MQGDIDRVVPKEQAEGRSHSFGATDSNKETQILVIFESIKRRGGVVEYKLYPGEGHGWRKEETTIDALERELAFYEKNLMLKS